MQALHTLLIAEGGPRSLITHETSLLSLSYTRQSNQGGLVFFRPNPSQ